MDMTEHHRDGPAPLGTGETSATRREDTRKIRYIIVMGVAGCGKSTVAKQVAEQLGWLFVEGDALHPPANVDKMSRGVPLDDADRQPWLERIASTIKDWRSEGRPGVIACSALRFAYRAIIAAGQSDVCFVHLSGERELIARRLADRRGHFMPVGLLESQLATLEAPSPTEPAISLDISQSPETLAQAVVDWVRR